MTPEEMSKQVYGAVMSSIGEAIQKNLSSQYGRNDPLSRIIDHEITKRETQIAGIIGEALDKALSGDLRDHLVEAAEKKVAKVLISKMEGEIEKQANSLRSDAAFRAKLTLAITQVVSTIGKS